MQRGTAQTGGAAPDSRMQAKQFLSFTAFDAPEHQPFFWRSGEAAILMVHGFPGTPKEVRPLARQLYGEGWTVQGLLLPGFGRERPIARRY